MYGEKFYQLHAAQWQLLLPLNNLEKRISGMLVDPIIWTISIFHMQE